jgi:hypothetical protein
MTDETTACSRDGINMVVGGPNVGPLNTFLYGILRRRKHVPFFFKTSSYSLILVFTLALLRYGCAMLLRYPVLCSRVTRICVAYSFGSIDILQGIWKFTLLLAEVFPLPRGLVTLLAGQGAPINYCLGEFGMGVCHSMIR